MAVKGHKGSALQAKSRYNSNCLSETSPEKVLKPLPRRSQIGIFGEVYYGRLDREYLWMRCCQLGEALDWRHTHLKQVVNTKLSYICDALHQFYGVVVTWVLESPL